VEISAKGGGILNSALRLQNASENELYDQAYARLKEVIAFGTGAIEIKSGYGLTIESEMKMLRVIKALKDQSPIPVRSTFLGAHAIPTAYKQNRNSYIDLVVNEMIPMVAKESLADYCDVFCETGFFTEAESDRILKQAIAYGLGVKVHANELDYSGGVQVGVRNAAVSVDHLECVGPNEIKALQEGNTVATLLPSTAFFLSMEYAPARLLIDANIPIALASDYNPGTTPSGKMPFVLSLACLKMQMTPEEAINAATLNGAYAMNLESEVGSISSGKRANFIVTRKIPNLAFIPYAFGSNHIESVYINGVVYE
jgi:imidazolonepropionase